MLLIEDGRGDPLHQSCEGLGESGGVLNTDRHIGPRSLSSLKACHEFGNGSAHLNEVMSPHLGRAASQGRRSCRSECEPHTRQRALSAVQLLAHINRQPPGRLLSGARMSSHPTHLKSPERKYGLYPLPALKACKCHSCIRLEPANHQQTEPHL